MKAFFALRPQLWLELPLLVEGSSTVELFSSNRTHFHSMSVHLLNCHRQNIWKMSNSCLCVLLATSQLYYKYNYSDDMLCPSYLLNQFRNYTSCVADRLKNSFPETQIFSIEIQRNLLFNWSIDNSSIFSLFNKIDLIVCHEKQFDGFYFRRNFQEIMSFSYYFICLV